MICAACGSKYYVTYDALVRGHVTRLCVGCVDHTCKRDPRGHDGYLWPVTDEALARLAKKDYWLSRDAFLAAEHEDGLDKVLLAQMLVNVTATWPDLDEVAAQPWPKTRRRRKLSTWLDHPVSLWGRRLAIGWTVLLVLGVVVFAALI